MIDPGVKRTPRQIAGSLSRWLHEQEADWPPIPDQFTAAFCRRRVTALADERVLQAKLDADLGAPGLRGWQPIGHVLAVVTEEDHLGVVAAMVAAALTGNKLTLKARRHLGVLHRLRDAIGWTAQQCRIADWSSSGQDDAALLRGVQGVLLAGSEALIRHYRCVTPPGVRLIEYGPRTSAALLQSWPQDEQGQSALVAGLISDTVLFGQSVCSSPQWVSVPDGATAHALLDVLQPRLDDLPPLSEQDRLLQWRAIQELTLMQRLQPDLRLIWSQRSGWAALIASPADAFCLPKGFRVIVGAGELAGTHEAMLQTLGTWPNPMPQAHPSAAFHRCPLGHMHERSLVAPHDGEFELAQWVHFVSLGSATAHHPHHET